MANQQSSAFGQFQLWWKSSIQKVSPESLTAIGIILFLFVGFSSYVTGRLTLSSTDSATSSAESTEHNRLLVPFILELNVILVPLYLTAINQRFKKDIKKVERQDIEVHGETIVPSQVGVEYLSLTNHSFNSLPDRFFGINPETDKIFCESGLRNLNNFLVAQYSDYLDRQEAVGGINRSLADKNDQSVLLAMIRAACDFALEGVHNDSESKHIFYKCVYTYVRAWLTCSIHYGRSIKNGNSLPIDYIFYEDSKNGKDMYIKAIQDLIDRFGYEPADQFLKTPKSREIAIKYLQELIELISRYESKAPQQSQVSALRAVKIIDFSFVSNHDQA